jgi:hypothetical protein
VSEIHIFDVVMLRDGGTTSFKAEQCGWITNVKLDTPFRGEPRKLEINFARVSRGQPEVAILLAKLDDWWNGIDGEMQKKTLELLEHKGASSSLAPEFQHLLDFSRVLTVRDYLRHNYLV